MKFEHEGRAPLIDPTWEEIEEKLRLINPKDSSYFILSCGKSYVQAAGAKLRLVLEHRTDNGKIVRHSVLGNKPIGEKTVHINYSGGSIMIRRSEVLTIDDCCIVFRRFFEDGVIPECYVQRDITAQFDSQIKEAPIYSHQSNTGTRVMLSRKEINARLRDAVCDHLSPLLKQHRFTNRQRSLKFSNYSAYSMRKQINMPR